MGLKGKFSVREIQDYLTEKGICIRHNVISRRLELMKNINENENTPPDTLPPKHTNEEWTELTDRHVNSIYRAFSLDTGNQRQDAHQSQVV